MTFMQGLLLGQGARLGWTEMRGALLPGEAASGPLGRVHWPGCLMAYIYAREPFMLVWLERCAMDSAHGQKGLSPMHKPFAFGLALIASTDGCGNCRELRALARGCLPGALPVRGP